MQYNLKEHKHRFAIWTAARAVQRSWTTTSKISQIIQSSQLNNFVDSYKNLSEQKEFDQMHRNWSNNMINEFQLLNVPTSYGRVAKIIAVYLKTSIIIGAKPNDNKILFIHPPIDRILLKNLPKDKIEFKPLRQLNWTQLNQKDYWKMVDTIRAEYGYFDWRLEILWRPEMEKSKIKCDQLV